jgi:hypothetical protein
MEPGIVNEYPPIRCCVYLYQVRRHTLDRSGRMDDRNVRLQPVPYPIIPGPDQGCSSREKPTLYRIVILIALAVAGLAGSANAQNPGPDPASNALGQLRNATSGGQGTGQTFDGGRTPTDATPSGGASVPDVQPSSTTARSPSGN